MRFALILMMMISCVSLTAYRLITIEDFDDGGIELGSWADEDNDPDDWELTSAPTYEGSPYALRLHGNTWKTLAVDSLAVGLDTIWQGAFYTQNNGEIQGIAFADSANTLFYSISGSEELDIEVWVTHYQGAFPEDTWNLLRFPIGQDWMARFDYLPVITSIVFINDNDAGSGVFLFDSISDISEDMPASPEVSVSYSIETRGRTRSGDRRYEVAFSSEVDDPDSPADSLSWLWNFGDGQTSEEPDPVHEYITGDDHRYTVFLTVTDPDGLQGWGSCTVPLQAGESTLPLTINFVGDVMLGRRYEENGGIIPELGVEAIFEPTLGIYGEDADINVANLECPLTTYGQHHPTKSIYFKGHPDNVAGLTYAGIDIVCLANNHTYDYLLPGMQETQVTLDQAGILHSGAGANSEEAYEPVFWQQSGLNLAFLRSCDRTGQYNNYQPYLQAGFDKPGFALMTPYYVSRQIDEVRDVADVVIVETHSGSEYSSDPGEDYDKSDNDMEFDYYGDEEYSPLIDVPHMWDIEIRHHFIDSGADAVICHHPHIAQGLELYQGKLIAHSLGNFAFDMSYPETMISVILKGFIDETGFMGWECKPVFVDDYIPRPATGELGTWILDHLAQKSRELDTVLMVDRENNVGTVLMNPDDYAPVETGFSEQTNLYAVGENWVSPPIPVRRAGSPSTLVSVEPASPDVFVRIGRELIWHGNMEDEGCSLWNLNSNYEDYDTDVYHNGARSIRQETWSGNDGVTVNFEERFKCYNDSARVTLHGWIRTMNADQATLQLHWYNNRDSYYPVRSDQLDASISGTTDWTYYWSEFYPPENGNYYNLHLYSEFSGNQGSNWFDDVGLIEWSEWIPVTELPQMIDHPNDYRYVQVKSASFEATASVMWSEAAYREIPEIPVDGNDDANAPAVARLEHNRPNPFNPITDIPFSLPRAGKATVEIFNIRGQRVRTLVDEALEPGSHTVQWQGRDNDGNPLSSGVYFYRLQVDDRVISTRKCLLLK